MKRRVACIDFHHIVNEQHRHCLQKVDWPILAEHKCEERQMPGMFRGVFAPPAACHFGLTLDQLKPIDLQEKGKALVQIIYHITSPPLGEML